MVLHGSQAISAWWSKYLHLQIVSTKKKLENSPGFNTGHRVNFLKLSANTFFSDLPVVTRLYGGELRPRYKRESNAWVLPQMYVLHKCILVGLRLFGATATRSRKCIYVSARSKYAKKCIALRHNTT